MATRTMTDGCSGSRSSPWWCRPRLLSLALALACLCLFGCTVLVAYSLDRIEWAVAGVGPSVSPPRTLGRRGPSVHQLRAKLPTFLSRRAGNKTNTSFAFHPSIDPKPSQLDPPVASIPTLEDSAWAADFVIGARHARRMVANLSALFLPFGGRSALSPPLTDSQLLMGELYHVWRQVQFATEVLGCAYHHHSSEEGTDRVMAQHAKVLGAALDRIGRGDTSGAARWNGTGPGDVLSMLRAHPLLGDFRAMGSLYDAVAAHSTAGEGGSGPFADDIAIDAMCVARVAAHPAFGVVGTSSARDPEGPYRPLFIHPHFSKVACVAPGTGQGVVGGQHVTASAIDIMGTGGRARALAQTVRNGLAALAGTAAEGSLSMPSRPVACIWAFFDDAFAANEFVVRALMRAPNAFILAQSPTYSDYGWRVCEGEGSGDNATTSHDGLPAPRLCLERRPAEFEGYARHPRLLAVPHADYREYVSRSEADANHAEFRARFLRRGSEASNHTPFLTADVSAPAVRLVYRSLPTGYAPMFHAAHHVLMGTHRDTAILRQREANWWALGELRGFFHHRAVDDGSRALTMPSFAEVFVVMQQLLRHYHQSDRVRMVAALNNVDLGDNVGGGTVAKNTYLFQHFLNRKPKLGPVTKVDCTTFVGCDGARLFPPFFNRSLSARRLTANARVGSRLPDRPKGRSHVVPVTAASAGEASPSFPEPMSREDMYNIEDSFRGHGVEIAQQAHMADFMIDVDGNANAFNSFLQKLCLGKPVFKVTSSGHHAQWYYRHLVNGVHVYLVPHDAIVRTIGEWLSNQTVEQAAAVGRNGRLFCERYFGDRGQWEALGAAMAADPWSFAEEQRAVPMRIQLSVF